MQGQLPHGFHPLIRFFHGVLCVNVSECICLCNMHMVRGEVQVEQLMSDTIINLRGPSKYRKDKSRFCVSKITYKTQDTECNSTYEKQIVK